jgi:hypothetical protein
MLKKILAIVALASTIVSRSLAQAQAGAPAPPNTVTIPKDTALRLALTEPLSSETATVGDDVPLRLKRPLVVNGVTVLAAGEIVHARVAKVKHAGAHCHDGNIALKLDRVPFADSSTAKVKVMILDPLEDAEVPISFPPESGGNYKGDDLSTWLALGPVLLILAPIWVPVFLIYEPIWFVHHMFHHSGCHNPGQPMLLPANATVGVEILEEHQVRY